MSAKRTYAVFLRYVFLLWNSPQRFIQIFIWATIDIVLWGFVTTYLNAVGNATFSFTPVLLGAVILWSFLIRAQQGLSTPALEDTWSHNLLNYFASPLDIREYILGLTIASSITSIVGLVLVLLIAYLFFGLSIFVLGLYLLPFLLILFGFGIALGIAAIAMITRYGPSAEWFVWPIPAVIEPFCGVLYPITVMPQWMQWVSYLLPPSYVFSGMRAALLYGQFSSEAVFIGAPLCLAYLCLAYLFYGYIFRHALRSGSIVRFSAENI
jgi:ABC-2 type transport system permease protein